MAQVRFADEENDDGDSGSDDSYFETREYEESADSDSSGGAGGMPHGHEYEYRSERAVWLSERKRYFHKQIKNKWETKLATHRNGMFSTIWLFLYCDDDTEMVAQRLRDVYSIIALLSSLLAAVLVAPMCLDIAGLGRSYRALNEERNNTDYEIERIGEPLYILTKLIANGLLLGVTFSMLSATLAGFVMVLFDLIDCFAEPKAVLLLYSPSILLVPVFFYLASVVAGAIALGAFALMIGLECFIFYIVSIVIFGVVLVKMFWRFADIIGIFTETRALNTFDKFVDGGTRKTVKTFNRGTVSARLTPGSFVGSETEDEWDEYDREISLRLAGPVHTRPILAGTSYNVDQLMTSPVWSRPSDRADEPSSSEKVSRQRRPTWQHPDQVMDFTSDGAPNEPRRSRSSEHVMQTNTQTLGNVSGASTIDVEEHGTISVSSFGWHRSLAK